MKESDLKNNGTPEETKNAKDLGVEENMNTENTKKPSNEEPNVKEVTPVEEPIAEVTTEPAKPAEPAKEEEPEKSNTGKKVLAVVVGIIIIILLLLGLKSCGKAPVAPIPNEEPTFSTEEDSNATTGKIEGKSKEEVEAELNKQVEDGMINISMNMAPVFADGTSEGNLLIVNEEFNKHPQVIEIYTKDDNTLIYKSGSIKVGNKVENAKLDVDLDAGDYECLAYFNSIDEETGKLLGKAGAEIVIKVLA